MKNKSPASIIFCTCWEISEFLYITGIGCKCFEVKEE